MPTWPPSLPPLAAVDDRSYGESPPDVVLRSATDVGPAKLRRRTTAGVRPLTCTLPLTAAEVATLDTFYIATCAGGALAFDGVHPRTGAAVTLRFTRPPRYTGDGNDNWTAAFALEVLP